MKKVNFKTFFVLILLFVLATEISFPQNRKKRKTVRKKSIAVGMTIEPKLSLRCTTGKTDNEEMTYLVGAGKLSSADKKRIKENYGVLVIPQGESERAKEIRKNSSCLTSEGIEYHS